MGTIIIKDNNMKIIFGIFKPKAKNPIENKFWKNNVYAINNPN